MAVITISRQSGSEGSEVARLTAAQTGYRVLNKALINQLAQQQGWNPSSYQNLKEDSFMDKTMLEKALQKFQSSAVVSGGYAASYTQKSELDAGFLKQLIQAAYELGNIIIVGRGAQVVLAGKPNVLHVRIIASEEKRLNTWQSREKISRSDARTLLRDRDQSHERFIREVYGADVNDLSWYDLVINTTRLTPATAAGLIVQAVARL